MSLESPSTLSGNPALAQDTLMSDQTFDQFGDLNWQEIKTLGNHYIGVPGSGGENYYWGGDPATGSSNYGPRYNPDGSCDTSHWLNFGSNDPTSTCFDYFPIIVVQGDVNLEDAGYAQGLFILDVNAMGVGSELDLEGVRFSGVIIGKGCVEVQYGSQFNGAIFVDGTHFNAPLCDPDDAFDMNHYDEDNGVPSPSGDPAAEVHYSSCAVQRVLQNTGLGIASGSGARGVVPIGSRAFEQPLY